MMIILSCIIIHLSFIHPHFLSFSFVDPAILIIFFPAAFPHPILPFWFLPPPVTESSSCLASYPSFPLLHYPDANLHEFVSQFWEDNTIHTPLLIISPLLSSTLLLMHSFVCKNSFSTLFINPRYYYFYYTTCLKHKKSELHPSTGLPSILNELKWNFSTKGIWIWLNDSWEERKKRGRERGW